MNMWMIPAGVEGLAKTVSRLLQKPLGAHAGGVDGSIVAVGVIGAVQCLAAILAVISGRYTLKAPRSQMVGGFVFGIFATVTSILSVLTFTYPGADIGISTFLVALAIVPGALLDRIFFRERLAKHQVFGIAIFLVAGWAMFDFPSLGVLLHLPVWALISLVIALVLSISNVITRAVSLKKASDPVSYNFWAGLATLICCTGTFVLVGEWRELPSQFWLLAVTAGIVVFCMAMLNLLAYRGGGTIALKTLIVQGVYLTTAVLFGVLVYGEPLTEGKLIGPTLFLLAFACTDRKSWRFFTRRT